MPGCNCKAFNNSFEFQHEVKKNVSFKDKGRPEYRCNNPDADHLAKYRVDGGLITDDAKCDYLLLNCEKKQSYFIELKGCDLIHAIEQIDKSIEKLKHCLPDFKIFARIVLTRVNTVDLRDTRYMRLKKKVKQLNGNLLHQSKKLEEDI
jgi:hypothetical protein